MVAQARKRQFKAEINQLLEIITHSIYTNREIFLRELISNASDALDKLRFLTASGAEPAGPDLPLEIRVQADKDNGVLTVTDTGLGMTLDEVVANIGTIAHSGSAEFMRQIKESDQNADNIIGRFGVGFYSVFMVADEVTVTSRSHDPSAKAVTWTSDGSGGYRVEELDEDMPRGTSIRVALKEEAKEFADPERLRSIIKTHSNFVSFPILLGGDRVNTQPALWREPKFQITAEQYNEFYSFLTLDTQPPLTTLHLAVDAPVQFTALAFAPDHPSDTMHIAREEYGLDLYVRRVLIARRHKDLVPEYLGFMRGVVDTEDLPLNLSRETLQENRLVAKMRSTLVKQALSHLAKMAKDDVEAYERFWQHHNPVFKLGYADYPNREAFAELLRFNSSEHDDAKALTSLADYVSRAREGQKDIYYISGPSREAVKLSPHLEIFRKKGLEVLYLFDHIDEFIMDTLGTYKEMRLTPAEQADLEALGDMADTATDETPDKPGELDEAQRKDLDGLLARMGEVLGERVTEVRVSKRLSDSPACLVNPDGAPSSQMQKILQVITKDTTVPTKILEINPDHALTRNLLALYHSDPGDEFLTQVAEQLYESALLLDGYLRDPHALVSRMHTLLERSCGWYNEIRGK